MLKSVENLLVLQDWDKKILGCQNDLKALGPLRDSLRFKLDQTQSALRTAMDELNSLRANQKELEIDIDQTASRKSKYATQQLETRKNEEYQALEKEMAHCAEQISRTEDQLIEVMEKIEAAEAKVKSARGETERLKADVEAEIEAADQREKYLITTLEQYTASRDAQREKIESEPLSLYDRLFSRKPGTVVVGVDRGVCGGCHMKLTTQSVLSARGDNEMSTCTNCGRILYYLPGMELPSNN